MFSSYYDLGKLKTNSSIYLFMLLIIAMFVVQAPQSSDAQGKEDYNEGKNLSTYTVTRTTASIKLDGKLDESDWKRAVEAPLKETNTGGDVPLKSTVKLLWDDRYLYVGFYAICA